MHTKLSRHHRVGEVSNGQTIGRCVAIYEDVGPQEKPLDFFLDIRIPTFFFPCLTATLKEGIVDFNDVPPYIICTSTLSASLSEEVKYFCLSGANYKTRERNAIYRILEREKSENERICRHQECRLVVRLSCEIRRRV